MAFTTAALGAVNNYLTETALPHFRTIGMRYEPSLIFERQLREVIAEEAADFAKKHQHKKWLLVGFARDNISYTLKRATEVFNDTIQDAEGNTIYDTIWKRREIHNTFKYVFISPSPELLEEVEEQVVVRDLGVTLFPTATVLLYEGKEVKYEYPMEICVNVERFEIQNFTHIDDMNNGVFSIFFMNAVLNYPVFTIDEIFDQYGGVCTQIKLKVVVNDFYERTFLIESDEYEDAS